MVRSHDFSKDDALVATDRGLASPLLIKVCQAANWMIVTDHEGNQSGVCDGGTD